MVLLGRVGTHDMWIGGTKALACVGNPKEIAFLHLQKEKKAIKEYKYMRLSTSDLLHLH